METIAEMNEQSWGSKKVYYCLVRAITDISNWQLSGIDAKKSLNFVTTIRLVPYLDMKASVELIPLIPMVQADELRWQVRPALEKSKPTKSRLYRVTL